MMRCEMCHESTDIDWFEFESADMELCGPCVAELRKAGLEVTETNR